MVDAFAAQQVVHRHAKVLAQEVEPGHLVGFVDDVGFIIVAVRQGQVAHRQLDQGASDEQSGVLVERFVQIAPPRFPQAD